jgi:hypothetical protein
MTSLTIGPAPRRAAFLTALRVEELPDGRHILFEPLKFYSAELRGVLIMPAGRITDYASVPRAFWSLFPKDGPCKWAATMHDGGYNGELVTEAGEVIHLIKALSDNLFREGMSINPRISPRACELKYRAVRRFGGKVYGGLGVPLPAPSAARIITTSLLEMDGLSWA